MFESTSKIIIRQTGDTLIAALDEHRHYTMDTTHLIIPSKIEVLYLLCLINSTLLNWCHRQLVPEEGKAFAEVKIVNVSSLPIRRINFTTPESDRIRLLNKSKGLYQRCLSEGDNNCMLEFAEQQLAQTPERADVIHDLFAFLAEQMIEMSKQKQSEVKGFLTWLERTIGAKIDDLSNKTKLRAYHEYDFNTLLDVLKQNHRRLAINPETRSVQEAIEQEFNASMEKLKPLKTRIAATDRLIDLIVYRLYGLTDDEIAIVERSVSSTTSSEDRSSMD